MQMRGNLKFRVLTTGKGREMHIAIWLAQFLGLKFCEHVSLL